MCVVSWMNLSPPSVRVRLPPAFTEIVPSTVYTMSGQTCGVVMTQFPVITLPAWPQGWAGADEAAHGGQGDDQDAQGLPCKRASICHFRNLPGSRERRSQIGVVGPRLKGHSLPAMRGFFI